MTARFKRHTPAEVERALQTMQRLCERTPREKAEGRMRAAKDQFTKASVAVLRGEQGAGVQAEAALQAVDAARRELAELDRDAS